MSTHPDELTTLVGLGTPSASDGAGREGGVHTASLSAVSYERTAMESFIHLLTDSQEMVVSGLKPKEQAFYWVTITAVMFMTHPEQMYPFMERLGVFNAYPERAREAVFSLLMRLRDAAEEKGLES